MRKIYYLTKTIVSIPCMGLLPVGIYLAWLGFERSDFGVASLIVALTAAYVWFIWNFSSPTVTPAYIKSAASPKRFLGVNAFMTFVFTFLIFFAGACLWPLLYLLFTWLSNSLLELELSEQFELLWVYLCANMLFQLVYLRLWEFLRKYRWIRHLTLPNVCW